MGLPNYDLATGICVCLVGTTLSNFVRLNIQKYSFTLQAHLAEADRRPYTALWQWWVGISCVIVGSIGDFAALSFAAQSVIMPVGSFTLVANIFFAHFWLKEALTWNDLYGTIFICLGAIIVCVFGAHESTSYTLDELIALYERWDMLFYASFILLVIVFLYTLTKSEAALRTHGAASEAYAVYRKWHPLAYAALSGVVGAQSVMFAKSTGELIKQTFAGDNQFNHVLSFVILAALAVTITTQTHVLAMGLKHFDALYIVPVFTCFFITFSVLGGAVYFEEFKSYSLAQAICFPIGVFVTIYGITILAKRDMRSPSVKGYALIAP
ncbi:hypothetical protein SPRG_17766 [Saprolegnia parasitica CBS 223.65]|uniref:Magnesium transporter n=1 Tax=Saprolegnia parasitica (strain CBS 223.65) TaxID=695850 RepID=A0A067BR14_SAPPC|nr:hypothetical protein SPRG_17766 [Saprolegnia parasitica CBS 223.65]KDO16746.1 hypothetical protein SPRG_17766 [Saprolegnia parasitica CBS 223.65]|eukprot:XP_012212546.1 hypothetical protein SPRG_17766 [Saprolegnia parasitica CBS 223.65]